MLHYLKKILDADFQKEPFKHIYIENFFNDSDFELLQKSSLNRLPVYDNTKSLIEGLKNNHYENIRFPGCVEDVETYINSYENGVYDYKDTQHYSVVESYGMAFRQDVNKNPEKRVVDIINFMNDRKFHVLLKHKFDLLNRPTVINVQIQKYLSGYEISPHPDIKHKALTFLININPYDEMETEDIHTKLLSFKKKYEYVKNYWDVNEVDRDWVPWSWCDVRKTINKNNTLLAFETTSESLHAIKLHYDHLKWQRTQIYGNLMFNDVVKKLPKTKYQDIPNA